MSQIIPVHFEPEMVICMYHLVCHGVFQVALVSHLVCANHYSMLRVETTSLSFLAAAAVDVMTGHVASQLVDVVTQIGYHRAFTPERGLSKQTPFRHLFVVSLCSPGLTVSQKIIALFFASLAVRLFVSIVPCDAKLFLPFFGHSP
jgi:hypothetical protein